MQNDFDLVIIGSGINGTGVARDASLRGMKVLVIDKRDIAAGASGANTGMIHGGGRYLVNDVATTIKSCRDSGRIQQIAQNLLFRIPIIVPVVDHPDRPGAIEDDLNLLEGFFRVYDRYAPLKYSKKTPTS